MTESQITVYLSVTGDSEEPLYQRVTELLKNLGHQVIDVGAVAPVFPVSDAFQTAVADLIRRSNVFIGIFGGDGGATPEQADGVVIETGRRPLEIEYAAARTLGLPQLLYVRESVLDSDSWLARFFREVSKEQFFRGFTLDEELLKWLPEDLILVKRFLKSGVMEAGAMRASEELADEDATWRQQRAPAEREFGTGRTDSKTTEQSSEEEGYKA